VRPAPPGTRPRRQAERCQHGEAWPAPTPRRQSAVAKNAAAQLRAGPRASPISPRARPGRELPLLLLRRHALTAGTRGPMHCGSVIRAPLVSGAGVHARGTCPGVSVVGEGRWFVSGRCAALPRTCASPCACSWLWFVEVADVGGADAFPANASTPGPERTGPRGVEGRGEERSPEGERTRPPTLLAPTRGQDDSTRPPPPPQRPAGPDRASGSPARRGASVRGSPVADRTGPAAPSAENRAKTARPRGSEQAAPLEVPRTLVRRLTTGPTPTCTGCSAQGGEQAPRRNGPDIIRRKNAAISYGRARPPP